MRLLHTSDWHLGKRLFDKERYDVFENFLTWLLSTIRKERVDTLIVAGDIFDNEYEGIKNPEKTAAILRSLKSRYGVYSCWADML